MTHLTHDTAVAVVTGASRGIGLGIAEKLVAQGARVVITARKPEALAEAVAHLGGPSKVLGIAGNAADRYPRRNIGIFAHTVLTCAALGLTMLSWLNGPTWAIYALLVMIGTARAFASPSVNTILPQLLEPQEFNNANAWLSSTFQLAAISGPAQRMLV